MAEFEVDGDYVEACLVKEIASPSLWEKKSMQAGSSVRIDGTQVMHAITLITNTAILIRTGARHNCSFAESQKETK